jgi:hypothetical protein
MFTLSALASAQTLAQTGAQSTSTFSYSEKDGEKTVRIVNVDYRVTQIYHPSELWVVLCTTTRSTQILGDKGWESKLTLQAWPMGANLASKPMYAVDVQGSEATLLGGELWQVLDATDPDTPVWSVLHVANGKHLFQSFVAPLTMRVESDHEHNTFVDRYAGLYVPPDDAKDARLREKHAVAVLSYVSDAGLLREALLTCDDTTRAADLRSYSDIERALVFVEKPAAIEVRFKPGILVRVAISENDLNLSRAVVPSGLHLTAWKR